MIYFIVFEFICVYIDALSILTKVDWTNYVQKLKLTLKTLKEKLPKCNMETYLFGQTKMKYLGLWFTHDIVKLINRKI